MNQRFLNFTNGSKTTFIREQWSKPIYTEGNVSHISENSLNELSFEMAIIFERTVQVKVSFWYVKEEHYLSTVVKFAKFWHGLFF